MSSDYARPQITQVLFSARQYRDAFGRLRTSNPEGKFDSQFTYDLQPLLYEQITSGSGATVTHDATNRCGLMTFSSTATGGKAYMQGYQHVRYQPLKSQQIGITFNFVEAKADVLKFAGLSDGTNGMEFQLNGSTPQVAIYSGTSLGNQVKTQADWNIDKLDGFGPSKHVLDITKTQILVIAFQALYVGTVFFCLNIDGETVPFHAFHHANRVVDPYIQSANLPVRCGMTCTGTVSTTMKFVCSAVASEGGSDEIMGFPFRAYGTISAASETFTHILSIQPKTTFNGIVNRSHIVIKSLDVMVDASNPVQWALCVGQALTAPSFVDVNATYSAVQSLSGAGTLNGTAAIEGFEGGFVNSGSSAKNSFNFRVSNKYPLTLNAAGAARDLGRLTVLVKGHTGASTCRAILNWEEIR